MLPHSDSLLCMSIPQAGALVQSPTVLPSKSWLSFHFLPLPCTATLPALACLPACLGLMCPESVESEKCSRHSERSPQSLLIRRLWPHTQSADMFSYFGEIKCVTAPHQMSCSDLTKCLFLDSYCIASGLDIVLWGRII